MVFSEGTFDSVLNFFSFFFFFCNPQTAGVPYTERNHLNVQRQELRIRNNAQETKENDVKMILFSLAYITLIKLLFCTSTGQARERIFVKKKKSKSVGNHFTIFK